MADRASKKVAIVDYGLGNLFSIARACAYAGLNGLITSGRREIDGADALILPGVGAFGAAMARLGKLGLIPVIKEAAASGKPLLGVCLGMQLLMGHSDEFGRHQGLGLLEGSVVRLGRGDRVPGAPKVPHVGWSRVVPVAPEKGAPQTGPGKCGGDGLLSGMAAGQYMYFVHSYHAKPRDRSLVRAVTDYGGEEFCAALARGNIWGFQFHPERSGHAGLRIYCNLAARLDAGPGGGL